MYITSISNTLLSFLFFLPSLVLVLYGGIQVIHGKLTIGSIVALSSYINQLFQPIRSLSNINIDLQKSRVAFKRYLEVIKIDEEREMGSIKITNLKKGINLENVTFSYQNGSNVIESLSFNFEIGKIIRILGANGKGKTTLIDLICGLLTPQSGYIKYDGVDVKSINKHSLKRLIGVVSQNTYLFNDTIRNNIKMGRNMDDERIISLSKQLGFDDVVNSEKLNLDSIVANNGDNLSGGQKRKITILRALVHDPQIIVLEESFTFLDDSSKNGLCKFLNNIKENKIIIIISHEEMPFINIDSTLHL